MFACSPIVKAPFYSLAVVTLIFEGCNCIIHHFAF
nr:MAG TPA: hypothetical protein [Caudoviricetes sp.]